MTQTPFWAATPQLLTMNDLEGHRVRFMVAEKHAPVETRILQFLDDAPTVIRELNPYNRYPILVDKHLICAGPALDELIHERYGHPQFLATTPVERAQMRMIAEEIKSKYHFEDIRDLIIQFEEISEMVSNISTPYLFGHELTVVDIAIAPLLWKFKDRFSYPPRLEAYANRLFTRDGFRLSLRPCSAATFSVTFWEDRWTQVVG